MKKFYIIPKNQIVEEIESPSADDAVVTFAATMDSDMNQHFMASDTILKCTFQNNESAIFTPLTINPSLFNVRVLKKRSFKDGTSQWEIGIEVKSDHSKYIKFDIIRGTKEDAEKRLEEIIINAK